jgi:hypothetical protein
MEGRSLNLLVTLDQITTRGNAKHRTDYKNNRRRNATNYGPVATVVRSETYSASTEQRHDGNGDASAPPTPTPFLAMEKVGIL